MMEKYFQEELDKLEKISMRRTLRQIESPQAKEIVIKGKKLINFSSNDYLGLASDKRLVEAAKKAMDERGFGSGASRLICGTMDEHIKLEENIAKLKKTQAAIVFSSGYMANVGILQALVSREDIVIADKLNHASIVDGIILSRAEFKRYVHHDMASLEEILGQSAKFKRRFIITDTVFSMDGDRAPLKEIVKLAKKYHASIIVDEAHGFGVLGPTGGGLVEELDLGKYIDVQMGTLSKAAGCMGAYVAGSKAMCDYLINHARSFIYTTAMLPANAAAANRAVDIIRQDKTRRMELMAKADYLRRGLQARGFETLNSSTPIIPVVFKDASKTVEVSKKLFNQGFFVQAIRPPTVPVNTARLRLTVMATHTKDDLDRLLKVMNLL